MCVSFLCPSSYPCSQLVGRAEEPSIARGPFRFRRFRELTLVPRPPSLYLPTHVSTNAVIQVDQEMLFEIILAANYLDIKPLLCVPPAVSPSHGPELTCARFDFDSDVGCKTVANMIKGKQPEEIRKL